MSIRASPMSHWQAHLPWRSFAPIGQTNSSKHWRWSTSTTWSPGNLVWVVARRHRRPWKSSMSQQARPLSFSIPSCYTTSTTAGIASPHRTMEVMLAQPLNTWRAATFFQALPLSSNHRWWSTPGHGEFFSFFSNLLCFMSRGRKQVVLGRVWYNATS